MKKKRHKRIDPELARKMAGGDPGWYRDIIVPTQTPRAACSKCGTRSTLIGADGECLKCRLQARKAAPDNAA